MYIQYTNNYYMLTYPNIISYIYIYIPYFLFLPCYFWMFHKNYSWNIGILVVLIYLIFLGGDDAVVIIVVLLFLLSMIMFLETVILRIIVIVWRCVAGCENFLGIICFFLFFHLSASQFQNYWPLYLPYSIKCK